jgi:hypothetical protein
MSGDFRTDLEPIVVRAETAILDIVQQVVPTARLQRIGPIDIDGPSWSCWVVTDTDNERDALAGDSALRTTLNEAAARAGFAPDGFTFQSQETVDRDYEGSWFYAMR